MVIRFADVTIDVDGHEVHRGGTPVDVQPQVLAVLVHLIRNRDRVVPKEELLDEVWQTRFVTESALTSRIKSARQAIGDTGRDQRMIRTVHGRGYRFVAPLDEVDGDGISSSPPAGERSAGRQLARRLPVPATPFVGRRTELERIAELLADPACRLLSIVAPGGMGKTRLALEVAARSGGHATTGHPDDAAGAPAGDEAGEEAGDRHRRFGDVAYVPLAPVTDADQVVYAVAAALDLPLDAGADPAVQVRAHLADRDLLLVLDNVEHLDHAGEVARFVADLLGSTARLAVLATSRQRLALRAEWVFELGGLGCAPTPAATVDDRAAAVAGDVAGDDAVDLFVRAAQRARPSFELDDATGVHVRRICALVGGMPLALELAAAWIELLGADEIAAEIENGLTFLDTELVDVPERQRSIRTVFDASWARLSAAEQRAFAALSVFRGGFTREAAEAVAGASLAVLRRLHESSMVTTGQRRRYGVHELLRQFGDEHLVESGRAAEVRRLHSEHYLAWIVERSGALKGSDQLAALHDIAADMDNVRAAWAAAVDDGRIDSLERALPGLWLYADTHGNVGELGLLTDLADAGSAVLAAAHGLVAAQRGDLEAGRAELSAATAHLAAQPDGADRMALVALVHLWSGWVAFLHARNDDAARHGARALEQFEEAGDRWGVARCRYLLGNNDTAVGRLAPAAASLRACREIAEAIGDRRGVALACRNLSIVAGWFGDHESSRSLLDEAMAVGVEFDDRLGVAYALRELGKVETAEGHYDEAVATLQRSIAITDEIENRWESAATADDLGNALAGWGHLDEAQHVLERCRAAASERGNAYYEARATGDLGALALRRGEVGRAGELLDAALAHWRAVGHEPYATWALVQLGHAAALDPGRAAQAVDRYAESLRLAVRHGLAPFALDAVVGAAALATGGSDDERRAALEAVVADRAATDEVRARARTLLPAAPRRPANATDRPSWTEVAAAALSWLDA